MILSFYEIQISPFAGLDGADVLILLAVVAVVAKSAVPAVEALPTKLLAFKAPLNSADIEVLGFHIVVTFVFEPLPLYPVPTENT
jgi:hypothetical protein